MTPLPSILADDFDGFGKVIGIVIVILFWGITAIGSLVKKANEQAKKKAAMRPAVMPPLLPTAQSTMAVSRLSAPRLLKKSPPVKQRQPVRPAPQAARAIAMPPSLPQQAAQKISHPAALSGAKAAARAASGAPASTSTTRLPAGGANAATIRRWLQPDTVRRQFILTELFQPPLALRNLPDIKK
jgi:hypothetical protein